MYIIQNALKNLIRNKGRNILLMATIFAIIATTAVTLIINNTADGIIEDYRDRFGSRVNIQVNPEDFFANMQTIRRQGAPQLTALQSLALAQSVHVMNYEMTATQGAVSENLRALDDDVENNLEDMMGGMGGRGGMAGGFISEGFVMPTFQIHGNNWDDFASGMRDIYEGRFPVEYGEAIISLDLAELNGLSVGDVITLYSSMGLGDGESRQIERNLTIVGIYFDMTVDNPVGDFFRNPAMNRRNEILTTLETVVSPLQYGETGIIINAIYFLHEPALLSYFEAEARALGLHPLLSVTTNEAEYYAVIQPVVGLRDVMTTFMIIVLVLGGIVLVLLSSIAIRERKYEIGVLRAMGMKKKKVALGLWTEMLAITAICLVLGLGVGMVVAQPISDRLLTAQLESLPQAEEDGGMIGMFGGMGGMRGGGMGGIGMRGGIGGLFGGGATIDAEPLSELDVSLGMRTLIEIIVISLVLASVAGLVSIIRITKYEPIKILMERD